MPLIRIFMVAGFFVTATTANSATVTIDFEELAQGVSAVPLVSQGVTFSSTNDLNILNGPSPNGNVLTWRRRNSLFMEVGPGETFSLQEIWIVQEIEATINITGYLETGGIVERSYFGPGFQAYELSFNSAWSNLARLEIDAGVSAMVLDNILLDIVPIPAAGWLFISGLVGLFLRGRRRAN